MFKNRAGIESMDRGAMESMDMCLRTYDVACTCVSKKCNYNCVLRGSPFNLNH